MQTDETANIQKKLKDSRSQISTLPGPVEILKSPINVIS